MTVKLSKFLKMTTYDAPGLRGTLSRELFTNVIRYPRSQRKPQGSRAGGRGSGALAKGYSGRLVESPEGSSAHGRASRTAETEGRPHLPRRPETLRVWSSGGDSRA